MGDACKKPIREEVLHDPRYPVHRIANKLRPYLEVLADQFQPEEVVLFGSFAYGEPNDDSDVDLLVVKPLQRGRHQDKLAIRSAWWPLLLKGSPLSFDLMLAEPSESERHRNEPKSYMGDILRRGIRLL